MLSKISLLFSVKGYKTYIVSLDYYKAHHDDNVSFLPFADIILN